ncbi:NAD(P)-dependent oxidoreductase [Coralloluteibacterium thermophilus]|uniref:NAD(P)-dependent oxidoreductase n=1 Tax=Coralloluteibacterium thermophilum TaxID=2707049 RepID=A0ABV9NQW0_9GAMM
MSGTARPVGFIGLGRMGAPMAGNLLRAGHDLLVWNRTRARAEALAEAGANVADTVADVFARCGTVILMLSDADAVDAVVGRGSAAFDARVRGRLLLNMGTFAPDQSAALARDVEAAGGGYVEAPVSGSRRPAEEGRLLAMTAGAPEAVARVGPLLRAMCRETYHCGPVPAALTMKLAVNTYLITSVTGLAEAFRFARGHGLDPALLGRILDDGPMASEVSRGKVAKLVARDYDAHAAVADVLKNNRLIAEAAVRRDLRLPLLEACLLLFSRAERLGYGGDDMAAVVEALEGAAPQERRPV